jgi:hypothetical protein
MLIHKAPIPSTHSRNPNRTFTLRISHYLRHRAIQHIRSRCEHDPPSTGLLLFHPPSGIPTTEEGAPTLAKSLPAALSSGVSKSEPGCTCNPIWYGTSFCTVSFQASFSANFEPFTNRGLSLILPKFHTLGVSRQDQGFTLNANYLAILHFRY